MITKTSKNQSAFILYMLLPGVVTIYLISFGSVWSSQTPQYSHLQPSETDFPRPTPTEAPGGLMGNIASQLLCPVNLSGVGPTWRNITIGKSTLQDLEELYKPYRVLPIRVTPYDTRTKAYPKADYAPLFQIWVGSDVYKESLGLSAFVEVCTVSDVIAALRVAALYDSSVPHSIQELIGFLGRPALISWSEKEKYSRLLLWPEKGISAEVQNFVVLESIYFYPFRSSKDTDVWPLNRLLIKPVPIFFPGTPEPLDQFKFPALELTLTASLAWPRAASTAAP